MNSHASMPAAGATAALLAASLVATACGETVPHGGVPASPTAAAPAAAAQPQATDLIPADLDLVVRVDLERVRSSLGPEPWKVLTERTQAISATEGIVREALSRADVVWVGLRVSDLDAGDRVIVVESNQTPVVSPDAIAWRRRPNEEDEEEDEMVVFDAIAPPTREGTARIVLIGDRRAVFVSPVEIISVDRVMRVGPDHDRGQPAARGLMSLDWRTRRLPPSLEDRFPSLAHLVAGITRVHATATLLGNQLELDARIRCHSEQAASRVLRFVETIIDGAQQSERYRGVLEKMRVRQVEATVLLHWTVPPEAVLALLRDPTAETSPAVDDAG